MIPDRLTWTILLCLLFTTTWAQESDEDLIVFDSEIHYQHSLTGPHFFLYEGDKLRFDVEPAVGSIGVYLIRQASFNDFREERISLANQVREKWIYEYEVNASGRYLINFEKDQELGYSNAKVKIKLHTTHHNHRQPNSVSIDTSGIKPGQERYLTKKEIEKLKKTPVVPLVDKEVNSSGLPYCEYILDLRKNHSAVVSLVADEQDKRTHLVIFRLEEGGRTVLLKDYQYEIKPFGFKSLTGGSYHIQFWGREVFKRAEDLRIYTGH